MAFMRWPRLALSIALLLLYCLDIGQATPLAEWSNLGLARRGLPPLEHVFRGDERSPKEIWEVGGFWPYVEYDDDRQFSMENHVEGDKYTDSPGSAYVSTSASFGISAIFTRGNGYIYKIKGSPNIISVEQALGEHVPEPEEQEYASLGGIHFEQIVGWWKIETPSDQTIPSWITTYDYDQAVEHTPENWEQLQFTHNPYYKAEKYQDSTTYPGPDADVQRLAGFLEEDSEGWSDPRWEKYVGQSLSLAAEDFMDKWGNGLGWTGSFPLNIQMPEMAMPDAPGRADVNIGKLSSQEAGKQISHGDSNVAGPSGESGKSATGKPNAELEPDLNWESGPPVKKPRLDEKEGQTDSQTKKPTPKPAAPKVVFYSDYLWPAQAQRQGGFLTPADTLSLRRHPPITAYSLRSHLNRKELKLHPESFFVSTHESFGAAAKEAVEKAAKFGGQYDPMVYVAHATPNMVQAGDEIAAAGGICWQQVMAWTQVPHDYSLPEQSVKNKQELYEHFERAYKARPSRFFQKNPDYDPKFNQYTANEQEQPQLLASMRPSKELQNFMKEHGAAVGFQGDFPLFTAPKVIKGQESAVAPEPHEKGVLEETLSFIQEHALAVALLPAVAALNLIPGVGEMADAAELAALSTDAVEGTGLILDGATAVEESSILPESFTVLEEGSTVPMEELTALDEDTIATTDWTKEFEANIEAADEGTEVAQGEMSADAELKSVEEQLAQAPEPPAETIEEALARAPDVPKGLSKVAKAAYKDMTPALQAPRLLKAA